MNTPTTDLFLKEIARIITAKDGGQLHEYLRIEPPLPPQYEQMVLELRQAYPAGNQDALEIKCRSFIPDYMEGDDNASRTSFISSISKYFVFLKDVNVNDLVETHDMLKALLK